MNRSKPATAQRLKVMEENNIPILPITHPLEIDLESEADYLAEMKKRGGRDPIE